jgi:addiction module HigA family antidote
MQLQSCAFWLLRLEISWRLREAIEKASTRFGLTINGGSVLFGVTAIATMWRSSIITRTGAAKMSKQETLVPPVHPGEILREDFMKPLGLSVNKLALELHVPATRIGEIVHERRRITAETALRLARYFNTNAEFWLNLQNFYDLEISKRSGKVSEIERQVHPALAS